MNREGHKHSMHIQIIRNWSMESTAHKYTRKHFQITIDASAALFGFVCVCVKQYTKQIGENAHCIVYMVTMLFYKSKSICWYNWWSDKPGNFQNNSE